MPPKKKGSGLSSAADQRKAKLKRDKAKAKAVAEAEAEAKAPAKEQAVLFPKLPKKSRARRKYVRRIRKRRELVVCDLVADDAKTLTMPLHTLLHTHTVGDPIPAGRARGHRLPEDIAQKLQALALTTEIEKTIRGAIPPSKLKRLERRIADRKGTAMSGSSRNKSSGGTRKNDSPDEHSGYARNDMNVGDQDQGPKSRGGGAKGKAEGGEGRGSRVPRRGFSR